MKNRYEINGDVATIYIVKRSGAEYATLVDAEDIPRLDAGCGSWYIDEYTTGSFRVKGHLRGSGTVPAISMHRFLMNFPDKLVDHINNDALDNRKCNLRLADKSENAQNVIRVRPDNTSGVSGVSYDKNAKRWVAKITVRGVSYIRRADSVEEAAVLVSELRKEYMPFSKEYESVQK